ncbi:MAG: hypothetical protein OXR72_15900 [Gemmatimonadota bacterium]|nr:hypothetical protein [Gemmatimonadota bacterium]
MATDRISAFDGVAPNGISGKGAIATEMSLFRFEKTLDMNHDVRDRLLG